MTSLAGSCAGTSSGGGEAGGGAIAQSGGVPGSSQQGGAAGESLSAIAGAGFEETAGAGCEVFRYFPCEDPQQLPGGFVACANGSLHRPEPGVCPSSVPRPDPVHDNFGGAPSDCYDADCADLGDQAFCSEYPYCWGSAVATGVQCWLGCTTDADCPAGRVCLCGEHFAVPGIPTGLCIEARCQSDADCPSGLLCASAMGDYEELTFACQTPQDECGGNLDCEEYCAVTLGGSRECGSTGQCGGP